MRSELLDESPRSDCQALAAFGTARVDDRAAAARFHANQKAVGACTTRLGGLISAFHVKVVLGFDWLNEVGRRGSANPSSLGVANLLSKPP